MTSEISAKNQLKYLFLDVDGCVSKGRGHCFEIEHLLAVKETIRSSGIVLILSSGRSQPYLEALSQILCVNNYYICENGAAIYDPIKNEYLYTLNNADELEGIKEALDNVDGYSIVFEPGKDFTLSLRVSKHDEYLGIENEYTFINELLANQLNKYQITYSSSAIDIVPGGADKGKAVHYLAELLGLQNKQINAFGDSQNDLEMLDYAAYSGAPANATSKVKQVVDYVTESSDISGLLDFLNILKKR